MRRIWSAILLFCMLSGGAGGADATSITAASPTHLFYTPMPQVNPPNNLVISLHEFSFSLPGKLQIQASLLDNIGRVNFGAKYGFTDDLSVGAGLAHSFYHVGAGTHGISAEDPARLGGYLCWGFLRKDAMEAALTPHTQIGNHSSLGADLGFLMKVHPIWSVICEFGSSIDLNDEALYLNADGGLRIHPPSLPFLNFDMGIDLEEFRVQSNPKPSATLFFDIIFAMVVK